MQSMQQQEKLNPDLKIACIILAAGQSSRMGQSKIVLPWGKQTVIGRIIESYQRIGLQNIIVVTGGYREVVEQAVATYSVKTIYNPHYQNGEMIDSLKCGLSLIPDQTQAVFIALGDQPEISSGDLQGMIKIFTQTPNKLVIPSFSMRRGHPWLIPQRLFAELRGLQPPQTLRDFIKNHENELQYYLVESSDILNDLDTPEDYQRLKPKSPNNQ